MDHIGLGEDDDRHPWQIAGEEPDRECFHLRGIERRLELVLACACDAVSHDLLIHTRGFEDWTGTGALVPPDRCHQNYVPAVVTAELQPRVSH